jgi:hypothetical protein
MKHTGANTSLSFADDEFAMGVEYEDSNSDSDLGIHVLEVERCLLSSSEVESISRYAGRSALNLYCTLCTPGLMQLQ